MNTAQRINPKRRNGFTLLELLVVISIIAILIGMISVSFSTAQKKARNSKRRGDMKSVQTAFEQYFSFNGAYSTTCSTMTTAGGTATLPTGLPVDPKNVAPNVYNISCSSTTTYCACATLENETGNSDSANCTYSGSGTKSYYCLSQLQ